MANRRSLLDHLSLSIQIAQKHQFNANHKVPHWNSVVRAVSDKRAYHQSFVSHFLWHYKKCSGYFLQNEADYQSKAGIQRRAGDLRQNISPVGHTTTTTIKNIGLFKELIRQERQGHSLIGAGVSQPGFPLPFQIMIYIPWLTLQKKEK